MESDLSSVPVSSGLKPGLLAQEVHTLSSRWENEALTGLQLTTLRRSSPHLLCFSCIGAAALMCAYLLSQMQTYAKTRFCPPTCASLLCRESAVSIKRCEGTQRAPPPCLPSFCRPFNLFPPLFLHAWQACNRHLFLEGS